MTLDTPSVYLTIAPNWADRVKFSHTWRTGVLTAKTGIEQRSSYFSWARKQMSFNLSLMEYKEVAWMRRMLFKYMGDLWGIPIWSDAASVSTPVSAGAVLIPVISTASRHFVAGKECILIDPDDFEEYEVRTIQVVAPTSITVTPILQDPWPEGACIYPVFNAMMSMEESMSLRTAEVGDMNLKLIESFTGIADDNV